ncbi:MAG: Flp pilus assembly complex ATPase component TadA [Ignavibacteria bacterium]|nr:Flp pilus assembly complex ATPase component TadA [Ignavibacteria bacterium]
MIVTEEKQILQEFCSSIPEAMIGIDRTLYVIENCYKIADDNKLILRKFVNKVLTSMIERDASDIEIGGHGNEGYIWMRVHGKKERAKDLPQFSDDESILIICNLLNENQKKYLATTKNLDFSYTFYYERRKINVRFRADSYFDLDTLTLNMRAINTTIRPLSSLEFHSNAIKYLSHNYIKFGLTLITGITGSGKSTTLDAIVDHHNKFDPAHIVIVAAPIEYVHTSNISLIKHREVGRDVLSFKEGVIQSLRQDPDIIIIGEMRDPDTIMAALEVTDTGHKVFSTLHTSSAIESIERIIAEVNPTEQERVRNRLADVMVSVISQKLVPSLDGKRVMAKEVLIVTPSVKAAIKNNNVGEIYMMINQGGQQGMLTMEQDLKRLYLQKRISLETAITYANNKTRIQQLIAAK